MKIGTITFHSSYNHGSCLQAYALQSFISAEVVKNADYEIINLRTSKQKQMYESVFEKKDAKSLLKRVFYFGCKNQFKTKKERYEAFIKNRLNCTKEYSSIEELKEAKLDFDYYISGSDQLWNLAARDFDWSNYLEFTNCKNKISYAASFGPVKQKWTEEEKLRIKADLEKYIAISVREEGSAKNVQSLIGKKPDIHVDPTLLLDASEWNKITSSKPIIKNDYIFLYDIKGKRAAYKTARYFSKKTKMPVVIVTSRLKMHIMYPDFIKRYDAGPEEFLNLVKNAKLVISSSFHGTVFSIIFRKPFFSVDGAKDFRISNLLKKLKLENRSIAIDELNNKLDNIFSIDYSCASRVLESEKMRTKEYLSNNLK